MNPDSNPAVLRIRTNDPNTISIGIEDSDGTLYAFMRLDERGTIQVHKQITQWLMARAKERNDAAAVSNETENPTEPTESEKPQ